MGARRFSTTDGESSGLAPGRFSQQQRWRHHRAALFALLLLPAPWGDAARDFNRILTDSSPCADLYPLHYAHVRFCEVNSLLRWQLDQEQPQSLQ
jgi:hypothetical protein